VFTTAASASGEGAFTDEEYMFRIDHYYGAAPLTFKVFDQGWLGRTPVGECDLISADVLHDQLDRLQALGVELSTNAVGELAVNTNRLASTVTRAQSTMDPRTHPQWAGWYEPGVNPCTQVRGPFGGGGVAAVQCSTPAPPPSRPCRRLSEQTRRLTVSSKASPVGVLTVEVEFLLQQAKGTLGRREMKPLHR
jgi:hypothetical protein